MWSINSETKSEHSSFLLTDIMKKLPHFNKDKFIAYIDPGCYVPLILSVACNIPTAYLANAITLGSDSFTKLQLCGLFSLPVALITSCFLNRPLKGARSLSLCVTLYTATIFILKALLMLPQSYPSPLTQYCGINCHLQPAPAVGLHYPLLLFIYLFNKKHLCSVSSDAP